MKTSKNCKVSDVFREVEKGCIWKKWVKRSKAVKSLKVTCKVTCKVKSLGNINKNPQRFPKISPVQNELPLSQKLQDHVNE